MYVSLQALPRGFAIFLEKMGILDQYLDSTMSGQKPAISTTQNDETTRFLTLGDTPEHSSGLSTTKRKTCSTLHRFSKFVRFSLGQNHQSTSLTSFHLFSSVGQYLRLSCLVTSRKRLPLKDDL